MNILPLLNEAERYLEAKDLDRAAALFSEAQAQCAGRSPYPLVGIARIAILTRRFQEAARILETTIANFPRCAEALTIRGVLAEALGDLEEAVTFHSRALTLDATLATAHVNLGRCHAQLGRHAVASASFQLAIQHGARDSKVLTQLGASLFRMKKTADSLRVLASAVAQNPFDLDAILTLTDALVECGGLQLALDVLENAKKRLPDEALIASRAAAISLRLKDLETAREEAWRHTMLAPEDEEAWLFAAIVDTMQRRLDTAEFALRKVISLNPQNWRAHYHLGGLFDAVKDRAAAKKAYRAAMVAEPTAWEPLNNLAIILLEEGTTETVNEARLLLDRAIRLGATSDAIVTHYNLALACHRLGDVEGMKRAAIDLLKQAPADHPMVFEARRVLKLAA
jgi:tetratricopeptide (TPR) repeat protein